MLQESIAIEKSFVDTNIFVYSADRREVNKRGQALAKI